ncbi:MAG TPA: O-antigen ligase family protein [Vicinamibacterales bacterium]|nr:O-antigen ligase family protein [Vicinamibacterales bacterium]
MRWNAIAERVCLGVLLLWLAALPLPFGSIVPKARVPLVVVPLAIGCIAALLRLHATRDRTSTARPAKTWMWWGLGSLLFIAVASLQLVPLPPSLLRVTSPESHAIWSAASNVASLAGVNVDASHPISIDPRATAFELVRLTALVATFTAFAILVRTNAQRVTLAVVLCLAALFETFYGVREAALERYAIWGWVNRLIFNRVTGTYVNPNHFAHYIAIVLPMALFLGALLWHRAGRGDIPVARRLMVLAERRAVPSAFVVLSAIALAAAVLLAQSRGALLALGAGTLFVAALLPGRRMLRVACAAGAGAMLVVALVIFLGPQRTVARFKPNEFERQTLVGRRIGIATALAVWQRFPILGCGLGTFERVVFMEQREDLGKVYHHAHNDYAEIAATAGSAGFLIAMTTLFGGYVVLVRKTFGAAAAELTWSRRAYQAAALASITIAMVHALYDFNFFIPANPATLAAIAGAAAAVIDHDRRTRR